MVGLYDVSKWGTKGHQNRRSSLVRDGTNSKKLSIHVISDGITRLPILEGEISHIELPRGNSTLGLTIVGGADTPLRCVVVQEVFPDSFVATDGRLQPGDQIIEVDGADMTTATHQQVCEALRKSSIVLKLGIYRERIEAYKSSPTSVSSCTSSESYDSNPFSFQSETAATKEGFIYVPSSQRFQQQQFEDTCLILLHRQVGRHLGIKLGGKRAEPGVFIVELMPGSISEQDDRLRPHDRLLYINGEDVRYARTEFASKLIHESKEIVNLIVCRGTSGHLSSVSQDSLFGSEENDRSSRISASSSECSSAMIEEEQMAFSDTTSDQSRVSPTTTVSSKDESVKADFIIKRSSSLEDQGLFDFYRISHEPLKQPKLPLIQPKPVECHGSLTEAKKTSIVHGFSQVFGWRKEEEPEGILQQKFVRLTKGINEGLGMRIGGGVNSNEGDTPIYVANINIQGPAGKTKHIKKGDIVLSVNNHSLFGLTHSQAVAMLKSTAELAKVSLTLLEGPETCSGSTNFVPSWLYWQRLPRSLHISKGVILHRTPGSSLGFSIVGGSDPQRGSEPIHVLFVVATSPAAMDGRLRCGDRLLAVDGHCLEGVSHAAAVCLLKHAGHRVSLEVVSWMGTEL